MAFWRSKSLLIDQNPKYTRTLSVSGKSMNQYQVGKRAGNGTTSTVYEEKDEHQEEVLALKVVKKILVNKGLEKGAMPREMQALQRIAHPNIVELREVIDDETSA